MQDINYKEIIIDGISLVLGVFLYAICFNLFLTPNNLVVSGFSGVSIVMNSLFGWNQSVFLFITNVILLIICFIFLGWKTTQKNIVGSILYPLMVTLSMPIATFLSGYMGSDFYLILLMAVILYGVSSGLIYRSGYTTGGSDIIMQIINKYVKLSESKAMVAANTLIIVLGMLVFGIEKGIYSFIILSCSTYFVDKIMFGISDNKLLYINTKKTRKVKSLLLNELKTGVTTIPARGGYTSSNGLMLMCVVSNNDYYMVKEKILEVDPNAFIIANTCYEVNGGVKRRKIPFL